MTRIYNVAYLEHLSFQPDPVPQPTKKEPDRVLEQQPVDQWRSGSKIVAVVDGYAEDAISKAKGLIAQDEDMQAGRVTEVQIVNVTLQNEAE